MLSKYMKRISERECPIVLSITDTTEKLSGETIIQRNNIRVEGRNGSADIYVRAREIYYRARRQRPVRAASIF